MPQLLQALVLGITLVAQSVGAATTATTATSAASAASADFRFHITDSSTSPGAICTYDTADPRRRVFVPVNMPRIYWPDTHAHQTDRGTVGWQIQLQVAASPSGPWRVAYTSSITKGTATDQRAANVAKHAINWRVLHRTPAWYRVVERMYWYGANGQRIATRTHHVHWYQLAIAERPWHEGSPGGWSFHGNLGTHHQTCPNVLAK